MNQHREVWNEKHFSAIRDSKISPSEFDKEGINWLNVFFAIGFVLVLIAIIFLGCIKWFNTSNVFLGFILGLNIQLAKINICAGIVLNVSYKKNESYIYVKH